MKTKRYRPSNGIEGEFFWERWCKRCANDTEDNPCAILSDTMAFCIDDPEYPPEWVCDAEGDWPRNPRCTAFAEPKTRGRPSRIRDKRQPEIKL